MIKKGYGVIEIKEGNVFFDGVNSEKVAEEYKTPFFLMSERQLEDNYKNFLRAFSGVKNFQVFYSAKTNFESEVLKTLNRLGSGVEISGGQDFLSARKAGFSHEKIIFDGPCKNEDELTDAVDSGIHCINIESIREAETINRIAGSRNKKVNVGIRIDPLVDKNYYDAVIDTYKRKFGYPITEAKEVFLKVGQLPNLNLIAVHAHVGSQLLDISMYTRAIDKIFKLLAELRNGGVKIKEINIGGGFPAQSMRNIKISKRLKVGQLMEKIGLLEKQIPSIADFGKEISENFNQNCKLYGDDLILLTEPGRSIVSNIGIFVGKVVNKKRNWLFVDFGVNDLSENIFFAERDFAFPGKMDQECNNTFNISGPTLSTADVLYLKEKTPVVREGDTFIVFDVGAYCIPRSTQFTQPRKAVYFKTKGGQIKEIRTRETYEDVIKNQKWE